MKKREYFIIPQLKSGQGHIEIIISFVIFVGALIFLFMFVNPFAKTDTKGDYLDTTKTIIMRDITSEVGRLSLVTNLTSGNCYNFDESDYGNIYVEVNDGLPGKYTIYFSELFNKNAPHKSAGCPLRGYNLGSYAKEEMIFYDKISELKQNYNSDYDNLKKSLGITNDFSFSVRNIDGTELSELSVSKQGITGVERASVDIPVVVIDKDGEVNQLILNINAW